MRLEGAEKAYGRTRALRGVDLAFGTGVTALLGPNGAGKSTLMHAVVGLQKLDNGVTYVDGHSSDERGYHRAVAARVGFLPQGNADLPQFRVRDFVRYCGWLKRVPDADLDRHADDALLAVDLDDQGLVKLKNLSGGMRRRANVAGAIAHKPPVLLLDEPSAGLDPEQRVRLREILERLGRTTAILLSTHLLEDVTLLAESVFVLADGRVAYGGTPAGLAEQASAQRPSEMSELESGYVNCLAAARRRVRR